MCRLCMPQEGFNCLTMPVQLDSAVPESGVPLAFPVIKPLPVLPNMPLGNPRYPFEPSDHRHITWELLRLSEDVTIDAAR